jgi:hypothetical protein
MKMKCPKCAHEFKAPRRVKPDGVRVRLLGMGEVHAGQFCAFDDCRAVIESGDECYASSGGPVVVCLKCTDKVKGALVRDLETYSPKRMNRGARDLIRSVAL